MEPTVHVFQLILQMVWLKCFFFCVTSFYKMLQQCIKCSTQMEIQNLVHGKVLKENLFQDCVHNKCKSTLTFILRYIHYI